MTDTHEPDYPALLDGLLVRLPSATHSEKLAAVRRHAQIRRYLYGLLALVAQLQRSDRNA